MKKLLPLTLSLILGMGTSIAIAAETAPPIPVVDVLQRLDQAGYSQIHNIQYKNGIYKVEAYGSQGQKIKFDVNAKNMVIPSIENKEKSYLTMLQVARSLLGAGYSRIEKIEFDDKYYEIKTYDANNKQVTLEVNSTTGAITKERVFLSNKIGQ